MTEKKYGWNGWKMPILHPNDPDFCEIGCPICVPARNGNRVAKFFQRIELAITFGGSHGEGGKAHGRGDRVRGEDHP